MLSFVFAAIQFSTACQCGPSSVFFELSGTVEDVVAVLRKTGAVQATAVIDPALQHRYIFIAGAYDRDLKVPQYIATALDAEWVALSGGGLKLTRVPSKTSALRKAETLARSSRIADVIERHLKEEGVKTDESGISQWLNGLRSRLSSSNPARSTSMAMLPAEFLLWMVAKSFDEMQLANLPLERDTYFSTSPSGLQNPFPRGVQNAISAYTRLLASEGYQSIFRDHEGSDLLPRPYVTSALSRPLDLVVRASRRATRIILSASCYESRRTLYDSASITIDYAALGAIAPSELTHNEFTNITPSETSKTISEVLATDVITINELVLDAGTRSILSNPDRSDFMSPVCRDLANQLRNAYPDKVAVIAPADLWFGPFMKLARLGPFSLIALDSAVNGANGLIVTHLDNAVILKPSHPILADQLTVKRGTLTEYVRKVRRTGLESVTTFCTAVYEMGPIDNYSIFMAYRKLLRMAGVQTMFQPPSFTVARFLGGRPAAELQSLVRDGRLEIVGLPQWGRAALADMFEDHAFIQEQPKQWVYDFANRPSSLSTRELSKCRVTFTKESLDAFAPVTTTRLGEAPVAMVLNLRSLANNMKPDFAANGESALSLPMYYGTQSRAALDFALEGERHISANGGMTVLLGAKPIPLSQLSKETYAQLIEFLKK